MNFSIVTPSFRNSRWLKLCVASVADQEGVNVEHIVQDSCSDDGTQDWLPHDKRVRAFIEKDTGMYDAINRGYRRATGDVLAYLNCDEQYLPGALLSVQRFFESHPDVEVALGGTVVVDGQLKYVCHRHSLAPHPWHVWKRCQVLTAAIFLRRRVIAERKIFFETRWRASGDFHWMLALMKAGVRMAVNPDFTSLFVDSGQNLGLTPAAAAEMAATDQMKPKLLRLLEPVWMVHHRMRQIAAGHFSMGPTSYSIYTFDSPTTRARFDVAKPSVSWWARLKTCAPTSSPSHAP